MIGMVGFSTDHGTLFDTDQVQQEDHQHEVQHHYLDQDDHFDDKLNEQDIDQYEKGFFPESNRQNHDWHQEREHDQLTQHNHQDVGHKVRRQDLGHKVHHQD